MILQDTDPNKFHYDFETINNDEKQFDYYEKYYKLHKQFLQPTSIKIDIDLFEKEIKQYHHLFRSWGHNRNHIPRYGISLVNYTGSLEGDEDIACSPLDQYNFTQPKNQELSELDFIKKTEVYYNLTSLRTLDPLNNFLIRSNILLWHTHANFVPHIDLEPKPNYNLRLWGINDPNGYIFDYRGNKCIDVEPGRIYLVDTTQFHYAKATKDWIYTFFIALNNNAFNWLENNV